jgi:hypothetical protein
MWGIDGMMSDGMMSDGMMSDGNLSTRRKDGVSKRAIEIVW